MKLRTFTLAAVVLGFAANVSAIEFAEQRGDFYYDSDGNLAGMRHVDVPENLDRRPMSFREKYAMLGIELPTSAPRLKPRRVIEKPESVQERGVHRDQVVVKFVEGMSVRLRSGGLQSSGQALPAFESILSHYPEASIRRTFSAPEEVLTENKETGELISGQQLADLNNYYSILFPEETDRAIDLANQLLALDDVETAYLKPIGADPCVDVAPTTPSWINSQLHHDPAPAGIDAEYAWTYHAGGDGAGPGFWIIDLEQRWCFEHEDLPIDGSDVVNVTGAVTEPSPDHGTAVVGEIVGCDTGFGMKGITPDVTMKLVDWNVEATWGDAVFEGTSRLFPGEILLIEVQILGPDTGLTCPCNCSQFEYVALEWASDAFDEIQTATANGVLVVEAAGNGSVSLDNAAYGGAFNRAIRDSQALIVGAAMQGSHAPECFTNFGTRVDFHGFGSGVFTSGYGDLWNQTGCAQDYTSTFSGTSSASPIIVGACSALQGIANSKYGFDLSPSQMREALLSGATAQGAPTTKNIGPMPNLVWAINWIEPDVRSITPTGWSYPVVPRTLTNSSPTFAPLDAAALPGNATLTRWNAAMDNASYAFAPTINEPDDRVYIDDVWDVQGLRPNLAPGQQSFLINFGPRFVKGGRHTIRHFVDFDDVENEWAETNNTFARQFIWTGLPMTANVEVARTGAPPAISTDWGPFYNAEGVQGTTAATNYWYAFAVLPEVASHDFDIRLNTEAPSNVPQAGWGSSVAGSFTGPDDIAFVGLNRNVVPSGTYYASVLNFTGAPAGNKRVVFAQDLGFLGTDEAVYGPFTINAGELLNLHEVFLNVGSEFRIHVDMLSGTADVGLSVFSGDQSFFDKTSTAPGGYADLVAGAGDEFVIVNPAASNYHGIAVWRAHGAGLTTQSFTYNLIVTRDPNLLARTPTGWSGPIVPRNTTDATIASAVLPATLNGNATTTSFNWAIFNEGANAAGSTWDSRLYVDDFFAWVQGGGSLPSGQYRYALNSAQGVDPNSLVRGGRHHLRTQADALSQVIEFSETDNDFTDWFVWTPLTLVDGVPVTRLAPPVKDPLGFGPHYSTDGFRADRTSGTYWNAIASVPVNSSDVYDLRLFQPSTGSKNGFGLYDVWSFANAGETVFGLVNYNVAPIAAMDVGALNWNLGAGNCVVQQASAPFVDNILAGAHEYGPYSIPAGSIVSVHEFFVDATIMGQPVWFALENLGVANLDFAIYDGTGAYYSNGDALQLVNGGGPGADETMSPITFSTSGFVAIVVYKHGSPDLPAASSHRIHVSTSQIVGAPEVGGVPERFALAAPRPNPFGRETTVRYDVPAQGGDVKISIYDLTGRRVATLVDGAQPAGRYAANWDGRDATGNRAVAGVYFVRLETALTKETRKITLLR
jgi:hypothetical protein